MSRARSCAGKKELTATRLQMSVPLLNNYSCFLSREQKPDNAYALQRVNVLCPLVTDARYEMGVPAVYRLRHAVLSSCQRDAVLVSWIATVTTIPAVVRL